MENSGFFNELASWVGASVSSAFFASLERFSCVNLATSESDDENEEETKDRPLMFTNYQLNSETVKSTTSVDTLPV